MENRVVSRTRALAAAPSVTFTPSAGASNVCNVAIAVTAPNADRKRRPMEVWLSDSAVGAGLTSTTASGTVTAKSATGDVISALTAKKHIKVLPLEDGTFTLEITDSAKTGFYVCVEHPLVDGVAVSAVLVTGNYG